MAPEVKIQYKRLKDKSINVYINGRQMYLIKKSHTGYDLYSIPPPQKFINNFLTIKLTKEFIKGEF